MMFFINAPIQSFIVLSITPLILGYLGYIDAEFLDNKDRLAKVMKGIGIGILIDFPFLILVIIFFSVQ